MGTRSGLNRLDRSTGKFERHTSDQNALSGTGPDDNIIHCIHEDSAGILWVGTDSGLNRFDPIGNKWKYYMTQDGLPGPVVCGILEDDLVCYFGLFVYRFGSCDSSPDVDEA